MQYRITEFMYVVLEYVSIAIVSVLPKHSMAVWQQPKVYGEASYYKLVILRTYLHVYDVGNLTHFIPKLTELVRELT